MTEHRNRLVTLPLLALILCTGCFHWVPIEPNYANGQLRTFRQVQVGGEGGEIVRNAQITWPQLFVNKNGQLMTLDLRQTPAARRDLTRGGIAAIVVPCVLGGVAMTAAVLFFLAASAASVAGG